MGKERFPTCAQHGFIINAVSAVDTSVIFPQKAHVCRIDEDISGRPTKI
jgi:hypothetical protein